MLNIYFSLLKVNSHDPFFIASPLASFRFHRVFFRYRLKRPGNLAPGLGRLCKIGARALAMPCFELRRWQRRTAHRFAVYRYAAVGGRALGTNAQGLFSGNIGADITETNTPDCLTMQGGLAR